MKYICFIRGMCFPNLGQENTKWSALMSAVLNLPGIVGHKCPICARKFMELNNLNDMTAFVASVKAARLPPPPNNSG